MKIINVRNALATLAALAVVACAPAGDEGPSSPCSGGPFWEDIPLDEVPASPGWELLRSGVSSLVQVKWFDGSETNLNLVVNSISEVASSQYSGDQDRVRLEECSSIYFVYINVSAITYDNIFEINDVEVRVGFEDHPDESYIQNGFQITILVEEDDVLSEAITPPPNEETEATFNFGMGDDGTRASLHQTNGVELFNSVF